MIRYLRNLLSVDPSASVPAIATRQTSLAVQNAKGCNISASSKPPGTVMKILAGMTLAAVVCVPHVTVLAQEKEVIKHGQDLYNQKCAICHGPEGKGDGVLGVQLKVRPADLSHLSQRNAGTFPFWQVYAKIDGREDIAAHGPRDMPVWGTDERYEGTRGRLASGQILQIVFFLQSIQED